MSSDFGLLARDLSDINGHSNTQGLSNFSGPNDSPDFYQADISSSLANPLGPVGSPKTTCLENFGVLPNSVLNLQNSGTAGVKESDSTLNPVPNTELEVSNSTTATTPDGEPKIVDYNEAFPALFEDRVGNQLDESGSDSVASNLPDWNRSTAGAAWGNKTTLPKLKSSITSQVFHLPAQERRCKLDETYAGDRTAEQQDCNDIMQKTGTKIEMCESRDQSLTVIVSGKRQAVEEARKMIVQRLQTQACKSIRVPKDYHRAIIGREGKKLGELEKSTDCRIMLPNRDSSSDIIRVTGPKEGIDKAIHLIQLIADEQSKLAQEHLFIPRMYYPWIRGPNNETVDLIMRKTGARVNIPPPSASTEIIIVTGEKEGVYQAANDIKCIFQDKKSKIQSVSVQVAKSQHKFIIGPGGSGISQILRATDVYVDIPPSLSESDTITLVGEPEKLGSALTLVYEKAASIISDKVECPQWLHKFIIGPQGSNLKKIVGDPPTVQVNFEEDGFIFVEGRPDEVKAAKETLAELSKELQETFKCEVVTVPPSLHRHIIGRSGANISKIKEETGIIISIPEESTNSAEVRLEGNVEGVAKAKEMIEEIVKRHENNSSRDVIIEQRFHKLLIGTRGATVRDLREKFGGVNISFPEPGRKSDVVTLRGPKDEVNRCFTHLSKVVKDLVESNFVARVPIFKDFHRFIIGKAGHTIKKIRDDTNTRIDIPGEGAETDVIVVTGRKENVEKAKEMILKIQNDMASVVTLELNIPHRLHSSLLYRSERLIQSIQEECGGVNIKFPPENSKSDVVIIRGPEEEAERAKKLLGQLAKDKELSNHRGEFKAKKEHIRFLIGRGGVTVRKLRDDFPDVRILFPRPDDEDQESVLLIGKKDHVAKVQSEMNKIVESLNNSVEITCQVDPKWHKHFIFRQGAVLREIQEQCGGITISFPRQGDGNNDSVILRGANECVEEGKKRILEIVDDLENQVCLRTEIPQKHFRSLLSNRGAHVQTICAQCSVQIKFPERSPSQGVNNSPPRFQNVPVVDTTGEEGEDLADAAPEDIVLITGRKENCQKACQMLHDLIPVTESVIVPYDFHRFIIGQGGSELRKLQEECEVQIFIPPRDDHVDDIKITGRKENVAKAIVAVNARVGELEQEKKDRELRNFQVKVEVPEEYHAKLIGPKGKTINKLREMYKVNIAIPPSTDNKTGAIIVTGYEDNAMAAKEEIEKMVNEFQSMFSQEITMDCRIHPRLIGQKGRGIRKIMDEYNVEIRFPRPSDPDPNLVCVTGSSEDTVYDCIDHLRNLEEEYLQDVVDRYRHPAYESTENKSTSQAPEVLIIKNAPWDKKAPDTSNMEDFPDMPLLANQVNGEAKSSLPVWGPKR